MRFVEKIDFAPHKKKREVCIMKFTKLTAVVLLIPLLVLVMGSFSVAAAAPVTVMKNGTDQYLADSNGMTLYYFTKDASQYLYGAMPGALAHFLHGQCNGTQWNGRQGIWDYYQSRREKTKHVPRLASLLLGRG